MSAQQFEQQRAYLFATATVGLGLALTMLPLRSVFTDWTWFGVTLVCAAPYWVIVSFFRTRALPLWWHSLLGLFGCVLVLTWIFLPHHLFLGVVPTDGTVTDTHALIAQARDQLRADHAPLPSTSPLRFLTAAVISLLVALTDILGVGLRRPLLAAAPMIEILAVASTTSSRATKVEWFAAAAIGFLLIVLAATRLEDRHFGPAVDGSLGRLGGVRVIAGVGIVAALVVPLALPGRSVNVIAKATHHSNSGGAGGGQVVLSNLALLQGQLKRGTPVPLVQVKVTSGRDPYYLRQSVLDQFSDAGWSQSNSPDSALVPLAEQNYSVALGGEQTTFQTISASFTVLSLGGENLPILANPTTLRVRQAGAWNAQNATVDQTSVRRGQQYTEQAAQPAPSRQELLAAPSSSADDPAVQRYLTLPQQPSSVVKLADQLTADKSTPFEKATAITDYFTNGKNGFVYSLNAPATAGRKAIESFLENKSGFCQQYAAAAAVLMREAGLPTRVVLGYTHAAPDGAGTFTVTTQDAHAWVETYFQGIGWIAFDPTPLSGADAARSVALPYAPRATTAPSVSSRGTNVPVQNSVAPRAAAPDPAAADTASSDAAAVGSSTPGWVKPLIALGLAALLIVVLLFAPRLVRRRQRRQRIASSLRGTSLEPLWQEVACTALDQDALWPQTVTVGQVPEWLGRHGLDDSGRAAISVLTRRLERDRFSAEPAARMQASDIADIDSALQRWARRAERRERLLDRWVPRSVIRRRGSTNR